MKYLPFVLVPFVVLLSVPQAGDARPGRSGNTATARSTVTGSCHAVGAASVYQSIAAPALQQRVMPKADEVGKPNLSTPDSKTVPPPAPKQMPVEPQKPTTEQRKPADTISTAGASALPQRNEAAGESFSGQGTSTSAGPLSTTLDTGGLPLPGSATMTQAVAPVRAFRVGGCH